MDEFNNQMVSKNVLYYLENVSCSITPTLTLIALMLQITTVLGIEILVLLFLTIALKTHYLVKRMKVHHSHFL